jgi:hypothetical protein
LLIYTEEKQHLLFSAEIIDYTAKKHCVLIPESHRHGKNLLIRVFFYVALKKMKKMFYFATVTQTNCLVQEKM